jgi:hypothetical protein
VAESLGSPECDSNTRPAHYEDARSAAQRIVIADVSGGARYEWCNGAPSAPEPPPERPAALDVARTERHLRLVPRPLAYCRPDNDNRGRR